jgi:hypothetical protein
MSRFGNSWELTKTSFRVARQDKELMVLPILSFLAMAASFALVMGIAWKANILPQITDAQTGDIQPVQLLLVAALYLVLAFVQTFFAAAIVAGAMQRLQGGNPTLGSALSAAGKKIGPILAWSAVLATANVVFQLLREKGGLAGKIVASLGSIAWNLATYFMIPVLLFETEPMTKSLGRSGSLFKKTWGEQVIGNGGVGLVFGIAMFVIGVVGFFLVQPLLLSGRFLTALPIIVTVVAIIAIIACLQAVVQGVYKAALYRFATTGQADGGFSAEQLTSAYTAK